MITATQYKALKAVSNGTHQRGVSAKALAVALWGADPRKEYLFTAVSNQGEGAASGKKAWLCAGSLAGKLCKAGLMMHDRDYAGYHLTMLGEKTMKEYEER